MCSAFHTVFISDVPQLTLQERDQVRRFINLVDCMYERQIRLICLAETDALNLFAVTEEEKETSTFDEVFAWDRTVSRLTEMQSSEYLTVWARVMEGLEFLEQYDLESLSGDDISDLWIHYDQDGSGEIDMDEFRELMEDITEKTRGHRHVSQDLVQLMFDDMDTDGNKVIDRQEFIEYLTKHGLCLLR